MKHRVRLTESDLHRIVKETVNRILREGKVVNNKPLKYIYNPCATFKQERKIQPDQRAIDLGGRSYNADGNFAYYYNKNGDKVYVNNDEVDKHADRYVKSLFTKMGVTDDEWWGMTERERELLATRKLNPHEKFVLYDRNLYDLPHYYDEKGNKVYVTKKN